MASRPAKATSFLGLSNLETSPISLRMAAPVTLPIPLMAVMGDSSFSMMPKISASVSFTCFSIKEICSISVLSWNVKLFLAKVTPKGFHELPVADQVSDQNGINDIVFAFADFCSPAPSVGLDRIDDMQKEVLFKKKRVNRELIVPGSFHTNFKVGRV